MVQGLVVYDLLELYAVVHSDYHGGGAEVSTKPNRSMLYSHKELFSCCCDFISTAITGVSPVE
jgi:hypothetical protein